MPTLPLLVCPLMFDTSRLEHTALAVKCCPSTGCAACHLLRPTRDTDRPLRAAGPAYTRDYSHNRAGVAWVG